MNEIRKLLAVTLYWPTRATFLSRFSPHVVRLVFSRYGCVIADFAQHHAHPFPFPMGCWARGSEAYIRDLLNINLTNKIVGAVIADQKDTDHCVKTVKRHVKTVKRHVKTVKRHWRVTTCSINLSRHECSTLKFLLHFWPIGPWSTYNFIIN